MVPTRRIWRLSRRAALMTLFAFILWAASQPNAVAGPLRASVVKVDITPDKPQWLLGYNSRQSAGIHDHIFHRVVAIDDGQVQFFLISTDICMISPSFYDEVMRDLEQKMGIKPLQVWWTTTHTHSAPEVGPSGLAGVVLSQGYYHDQNTEYTSWVRARLIDAVSEAREKLAPARLGVAWGISMANMNRRARDVTGPAFLGMNPDGPMDRRIGLIRLEKADGKPLALIANYAMHGTVLGPQNLEISADAPGAVSEYVEEKTGVPMLYINGAAGNLAPIYSVYPDFESGHLSQYRVLLGDRILEANQRLGPTTSEVKIHLGEQVVETHRKKWMGWPPDLGEFLRKTSTGELMVRLPIRFLIINNDIAIWGAPLELFCEIAMQVRDRSPFPYTFYFGYCNGWLSYLPTKEEFAYGGYEPDVSPYTEQAEGDLIRAVASYLQGIASVPSQK
jgi:neutral ceramidase